MFYCDKMYFLQAAAEAEKAGHGDTVIIGAFLHDIGAEYK